MMNPTLVRRRLDPGLEYAVAVLPALLVLVHGYDRLAARLHADDDSDRGSIVEMVLSLSGARLKMTVLGLSEHHMYGLATCRAP